MPSDQAAMLMAIKFLSARERFESEVRKHLADFEQDVVDGVIEDLKFRNILDDERSARSYLRVRSGRKATGVFKMEHDLRSRGVPEEVITRITGEISEPDSAIAALAGKFRPTLEFKDKGYRFLLSRGFSYESAINAVRRFFISDV